MSAKVIWARHEQNLLQNFYTNISNSESCWVSKVYMDPSYFFHLILIIFLFFWLSLMSFIKFSFKSILPWENFNLLAISDIVWSFTSMYIILFELFENRLYARIFTCITTVELSNSGNLTSNNTTAYSIDHIPSTSVAPIVLNHIFTIKDPVQDHILKKKQFLCTIRFW